MPETLTEEIKKEFISLECRLSPENLCCDGEISRTEVNRRRAQINREWRALERRIGRRVEQESGEVLAWDRKINKW
jgi:hypothetical protein